MKLIKFLFNSLLTLTSGNLFCITRSIGEKILYNQNRSLYYVNKNYIRNFKDLNKKIYFPDKERTRLYSRGFRYRIETLSQMYLLDKIKFKNGDVIIDCGANIGEIKFIFDYKKKKINYFAFEPGDKEFICLKKNLKTNNLFNLGLWNINSKINFYEKTDTADSSFIKNLNYSKVKKKTVKRLDTYNFKNIKLLKVEAEGAEPEVIKGAEKILNKIQFISVDCGPERGIKMKKTNKEVIKILNKNKFKLIKKSKIRDVYLFKNINY